jgi:uncharacterized protein YbcV (DUF1398 family)
MNLERFRIYFEEFFNCEIVKEIVYMGDKTITYYFESNDGLKITIKEEC